MTIYPIHPVRIDDLNGFLAAHPHVQYTRSFDLQVEELRRAYPVQELDVPVAPEYWFVPWRGVVCDLLTRPMAELLIESRQRVLFSELDLKRIRRGRVGIAGSSVGSRVMEPLAHGPALELLRIADFDVVTLSGLGRQPFGIANLGLPKVVASARLVTEVRPWANIEIWTEGVTQDNLDNFVRDLDVVVDAMDDPGMKMALRLAAQRHGVDVLMGTDIENGLIDYEPYGEIPGYVPFHGALSDATVELLAAQDVPRERLLAAIAEIVDLRLLTLEGLQMAAALVAGRITSMSQIGTTATQVGAAIARMIHLRLAGHAIKVGRTVLGNEEAIRVRPADYEAERMSFLAGIARAMAPQSAPEAV